MEKIRIVGLGLATIDILMRLGEMPRWEQFNYLDDLKFEGGGPAGTALVAVSRLGVKAGFIGTAGDDPAGALKVETFTREGVDASRMVRRPFPEDQVALVFVHAESGERTFAAPRKFGREPVRPEELDRAYLTSAEILHLDGFHFEAAVQAARWVREAGKRVVLDAGKTTGALDPRLPELVRLSDVAICAAGVIEYLTGVADLSVGARQVLDMGPQVVVETRGEAGCHTFTRAEAFHTPAFRVSVVDTTGAGDVFHGAYAVGLLHGWDLRRVAALASAAAALKCIRLGGRSGIPTMWEVEDFLSRAR
jgi:sulfofructose kinase